MLWGGIDKGVVEGEGEFGGDVDEIQKPRESVAADAVRDRVRGEEEGQK